MSETGKDKKGINDSASDPNEGPKRPSSLNEKRSSSPSNKEQRNKEKKSRNRAGRNR